MLGVIGESNLRGRCHSSESDSVLDPLLNDRTVSPPRKSATEPRAAALATGILFSAKSLMRLRRGAFSEVSSISVDLDMMIPFLRGLVLIIGGVFFAEVIQKAYNPCFGGYRFEVNV
nr:MAG TPA: hypothetical protein [Caudoviricetes sp.]